jgi:RimJ/RimL family protein N-acetyltransferase
MAKAATYAVVESLPGGRPVEIRALRSQDRADFMAAVDRSSAASLYTRFFSPKRRFAEDEVSFFLQVDFINHVALVAVLNEGGRPVIVGGGRYILLTPRKAEMALTVVDQYQGQGVGTTLVRHLLAIARDAGLTEMHADVLSDNQSMLKVLAKSGLPLSTTREAGVVHVVVALV